MDSFKGATQEAQQAAKSAGESVAGMGGIRETGRKDSLSGGIEYRLEVEVRPTGRDPYAATFSQQLLEQSVDGYKQKIVGEVVVNVDPDDPKSMLLWG
jgi:hypothetical protein